MNRRNLLSAGAASLVLAAVPQLASAQVVAVPDEFETMIGRGNMDSWVQTLLDAHRDRFVAQQRVRELEALVDNITKTSPARFIPEIWVDDAGGGIFQSNYLIRHLADGLVYWENPDDEIQSPRPYIAVIVESATQVQADRFARFALASWMKDKYHSDPQLKGDQLTIVLRTDWHFEKTADGYVVKDGYLDDGYGFFHTGSQALPKGQITFEAITDESLKEDNLS